MKRSVLLLVVLLLSSLLIVACGGGSGDSNSFDGISKDSNIQVKSLKKSTNVDHTKNQIFETNIGKINLPANALKGDYDIEISKIDTSTLTDNDKSILKSKLGLNSKSEFLSPVLGINLTSSNPYNSRASVNIQGNGIQLFEMTTITINLNVYNFDWINNYYYVAFGGNNNSALSYTPLSQSNFQGSQSQLVVTTTKLSSTYVVISTPNEISSGVIPSGTDTDTQTGTDTSTDTDSISGFWVLPEPNELVASQTTGKFDEDMTLCVGLDYTGNNPFAYTSPKIEFLAFKPFDLGNSIKSTYEDGVYSYTYERFTTPESDFANHASFTLTIPTKGVGYDADKFPENIFVTAKFKAKDNKDYQTSPTGIAFKFYKSEITQMKALKSWSLSQGYGIVNVIEKNNVQLVAEDVWIDCIMAYKNASPSFDITPVFLEITSDSPFELKPTHNYTGEPIDSTNGIVSSVYDDSLNQYTCKIQIPARFIVNLPNDNYRWFFENDFNPDNIGAASFSICLIGSGTVYDPQKIPEHLSVKATCDGKSSNICLLSLKKPSEASINYLKLFCNQSKQYVASDTNRFINDLKFEVTAVYDGSDESFKNKPVKIEFLSNSPFDLAGAAIGTLNNDNYMCEIELATYSYKANQVASYVLTIPLKNTPYEKSRHPYCIIARAKTDEQISDPITLYFINKEQSEQPPAPTCFTAGGSGTADDPFLIATAEDLNNIRNYPDYYYKQIADIDLTDFLNDYYYYDDDSFFWHLGGWIPIDNFSKIYDGNNYTIGNIRIARNLNGVGLFGTLSEGAVLKNIILSGADINGIDYVGSVVGIANNQNIIDNCHIVEYGQATGSAYVGGIAGIATTITNCSVTGLRIRGRYTVGGIAGKCQNISSCSAQIEVVGFSYYNGLYYNNNIGGIVGSCESGNINNCAVFNSRISGSDYIGGIVGETSGSNVRMNNCMYANNSIDFNYYEYNEVPLVIGGIVGKNNTSLNLSNCFVVNDLSYLEELNIYYGGILGENTISGKLEFRNCNIINYRNTSDVSYPRFWYNNIVCDCYGYRRDDSIFSSIYCWKPYDDGHDDVTEITKSEFWGASTQSTFWANSDKLGWDFDNVWEFRSGNLPQLKGMPSVSDPTYINE